MNAKTAIATALLFTAFHLNAARAQTPSRMSAMDTVAPPPGVIDANGDTTPMRMPETTMSQLSSWIRGDKYSCNGCVGSGCGTPIQSEVFFRIGPSLPFGNGTVVDVLQPGWYIGGGYRLLCFDQCLTSAWTLEVGIANIYNHAHAPNNYPGIPLNILVPQGVGLPGLPVSFGKNGVPGVTLESLNRTFLDLGGGREWYLWGAANGQCSSCRVGCDAGGRWGSESANFNEIPHRTDVIGGVWAAAHFDVEYPCCGCCIFQAGFRVEYGYTWSDILQIQNKSDVQDVNLLFNAGVRF